MRTRVIPAIPGQLQEQRRGVGLVELGKNLYFKENTKWQVFTACDSFPCMYTYETLCVVLGAGIGFGGFVCLFVGGRGGGC